MSVFLLKIDSLNVHVLLTHLRAEYDIDIILQVRGAAPSHSLWWLGAFAYRGPVGQRWKHHSHSQS